MFVCHLPSLRHKFNDRSFLTCLCRIFLCRNLGAWQALQVWDEKNYKAISHNWINVDIPNYVNNNFWSNRNSELTDRQSGDLKNNRKDLLHLTWYTAVLFLVNQVLKIWQLVQYLAAKFFFFCQQQRQLRDKPERWAHKISLLSSSHCLEYTWFQRDSMISEDVLKTPTFKHMNRRWHFLQFHRTWVYTQALWFVARISTFIGLMLRSYFYQFSLINWPIAILIQNDIHALDEIRITIDTDDARAKVIYQIFQA